MDPIVQVLQLIFSEKGIMAWLFAFTFIVFVWKGIPFLLDKFDSLLKLHATMQSDLLLAHADSQKRQERIFENTIDKIVTTLMESTNQSKAWHEEHSREIKWVNEEVKKVKKFIETKYQTRI